MPANRSQSYASLFAHNRANRDYEGVGGWRDTQDDSDEAQWLNMNANLELPASSSDFVYSGSSSPTSIRRRHHVRSLTGGSQRLSMRDSWYAATPGGGSVKAGGLSRRGGSDSGNASRNRTPDSDSEEMGYFSQVKKRRKSSGGASKGGTQEQQEGRA
jgi:hypothetical protein